MPRLVVPIFWRPGAIGDEEVAVDLDAEVADLGDFLEEGDGVEDDTVADDAFAAGAEYAAGNELEDELLVAVDDGVTGVMAAGVARDGAEPLAEYVDNLALALVAPLGAEHYCCPGLHRWPHPTRMPAAADGCAGKRSDAAGGPCPYQ